MKLRFSAQADSWVVGFSWMISDWQGLRLRIFCLHFGPLKLTMTRDDLKDRLISSTQQ